MEVYFNELSLNGIEQMQYQDIRRIRDVYLLLRSKGINTCRISYDDYQKLMTIVQDMERNIRDFLFAFLRQPYESPDIEEKQDLYFGHQWQWQGQKCYGLALASMMESLSLSTGDEIWDIPHVIINQDADFVTVRNLYGEETFQQHLPWFEQIEEIQLIECTISPELKKIDLREDHGIDKLMDFSKRIVNSPYVCEIVNSTEFHSYQRHFISRIHENGLIEIVLPWTDAGYGVVVKTTGRNRRETEKIAEILKDRYGKR